MARLFKSSRQGRAGSAPVRYAHRSRAGTALISFYRTNVTLTGIAVVNDVILAGDAAVLGELVFVKCGRLIARACGCGKLLRNNALIRRAGVAV